MAGSMQMHLISLKASDRLPIHVGNELLSFLIRLEWLERRVPHIYLPLHHLSAYRLKLSLKMRFHQLEFFSRRKAENQSRLM